jgi:hypothetical protein
MQSSDLQAAIPLAELSSILEFSQMNTSSGAEYSIPDGVEEFLLKVARGTVSPKQLIDQWLLLRNALGWRIRQLLKNNYATRGFLGPVTTDFASREREIESLLLLHEEVPCITIQRLCEVLCIDSTRPAATHKLMNSLQRCLQVYGGDP